MKREEVEEMLAQCEQAGDSVETVCTLRLADLCRAWLALDASEAAEVEACREEFAPEEFRLKASIDLPAEMAGRRVRIVVEAPK